MAAIIAAVAKAKGRKNENVTVAVLDRTRHSSLVNAIRTAGARIKLLPDGDLAGAMMAADQDELDSGVDMLG